MQGDFKLLILADQKELLPKHVSQSNWDFVFKTFSSYLTCIEIAYHHRFNLLPRMLTQFHWLHNIPTKSHNL